MSAPSIGANLTVFAPAPWGRARLSLIYISARARSWISSSRYVWARSRLCGEGRSRPGHRSHEADRAGLTRARYPLHAEKFFAPRHVVRDHARRLAIPTPCGPEKARREAHRHPRRRSHPLFPHPPRQPPTRLSSGVALADLVTTGTRTRAAPLPPRARRRRDHATDLPEPVLL